MGELAVKVANGKGMITSANVLTADIGASNGVLHVIDTELLLK